MVKTRQKRQQRGDDWESQVLNMLAQVDSLKDENDQLARENANLKEDNEQLVMQVESYLKTIERMKPFAMQPPKNETMKMGRERTTNPSTETKDDDEEVSSDLVAKMSEQIAHLTFQLRVTIQEKNDLQDAIEALEDQASIVTNNKDPSTRASWRTSITAPSLADQVAESQDKKIILRVATRRDVPSIQECLEINFDETYRNKTYYEHIRQWPDLTLVAEEVDENRRPRFFNPKPKIVAYIMARVAEAESERRLDDENDHDYPPMVGYVTSLAVREEFRRRGLARALLTQLHFHFEYYEINSSELHVRVSNEGAFRLYEEEGYQVVNIVPSYYTVDVEDGYLMKKWFPDPDSFPEYYDSDLEDQMSLPRVHYNASKY